MKKIVVGTIIFILLLLDYAALDDITTGNEPSYLGEYAILVISMICFPVLFVLWRKY